MIFSLSTEQTLLPLLPSSQLLLVQLPQVLPVASLLMGLVVSLEDIRQDSPLAPDSHLGFLDTTTDMVATKDLVILASLVAYLLASLRAPALLAGSQAAKVKAPSLFLHSHLLLLLPVPVMLRRRANIVAFTLAKFAL